MADCATPPEGHCAFFLTKKKRFCRFRPNQGHKYCAEHSFTLGVELDRKRIVCPLNPKHTCYEDNLDKHLKKCNSRKRKIEDYFDEGINAGRSEGAPELESQTAVKATDPERLKQIIDKVNKLYEEHIGRLDRDIRSHECLKEELENPSYGQSALRHRRQQASLIGQLDCLGLLTPGHCYVEMGAGKGQLSHWVRKAVSTHDDAAFLLVDRSSVRYKVDGYHKEEEKVQFERIKIDIEHLNLGKVPVISNTSRPIVAIGKHLCGAATDLTLRCLMKTLKHGRDDPTNQGPSSKRQKGENKNESEQKSMSDDTPSQASRVESASLDEASTQNKDKSEDACAAKVKKTENSSADVPASAENRGPAGILIALCCHHQCSWQAYVGKPFMQRCGISASDFNLLTRLSSWAVCGWRGQDGSFDSATESKTNLKSSEAGITSKDDTVPRTQSSTIEEEAHTAQDLMIDTDNKSSLQLSEKEKEVVGWRCKRLIDFGRACYLQDNGMRSVLKEYIDSLQTPENVVLVAAPDNCSETATCS